MFARVKAYLALPSTIPQRDRFTLWMLFWVSFLWSTSSLMVVSVFPSFLVEELGMGKKHVGLLEGVAISLSFGTKVFSGVLSDLLRRRQPLILWGSIFTVVAKAGFALANSFTTIFVARTLDRASKGLRSAPTDAFLADLATGPDYGKVYGLRQSLYTMGAVAGAVLAMAIMAKFGVDYQLIFTLATVPAALSVLLLLASWRKTRREGKASRGGCGEGGRKWSFRDLKELPPAYWYLMLIVTFLMTARFSEAFINLRVKELGLPIRALPLLVIFMDLVHAGVAYPLGRWSDRFSKERILASGMAIQCFAALLLARASNLGSAMVSILLIGLYMGMTQGVLRSMIAKLTPKHLRGSAFAVFYLISGLAVFCGNTLAGSLADHEGLAGAFFGGAGLTLIALSLLLLRPFAFLIFTGGVGTDLSPGPGPSVRLDLDKPASEP